MKLNCGTRFIDLTSPKVMGILNVTPDSFSDGGRFTDVGMAVEHARRMLSEGADIVDVGGESTRPGARPVSESEELDRVIPIVEALSELDVPVSVDTTKPEVMRGAVSAGACLINDVNALQGPGAIDAAAESGAAVCLMHMQGEPRTMQKSPQYDDVVKEVGDFLQQRVQAVTDAGVGADQILLDPGFGFGKTLDHNLALLANLQSFGRMGYPILVGISRKSMVGALLGNRPVEDRLYGSLSAAVLATVKGAAILRVHDVAPTVDALKIAHAVIEESN